MLLSPGCWMLVSLESTRATEEWLKEDAEIKRKMRFIYGFSSFLFHLEFFSKLRGFIAKHYRPSRVTPSNRRTLRMIQPAFNIVLIGLPCDKCKTVEVSRITPIRSGRWRTDLHQRSLLKSKKSPILFCDVEKKWFSKGITCLWETYDLCS